MDTVSKGQDDRDTQRSEIRRLVVNMLRETERQRGFSIVFACETGSRCYGLDTSRSDVDVKGMFIYSTERYLNVEKLPQYLKINHSAKLREDIDLDLELIDVRKYLRGRTKNTILDESALWFRNPDPYINILKDVHIEMLATQDTPPLFQIWSKIAKYHQKFSKSTLSSDPTLIIVKDVLNSIVQSFQLLNVKYSLTYRGKATAIVLNFEESAQNLMQALHKYIEGKEHELLIKVQSMYKLAKQLFETKKLDNKARIVKESKELEEYFQYMDTYILNDQPQERKALDSLEVVNRHFNYLCKDLAI